MSASRLNLVVLAIVTAVAPIAKTAIAEERDRPQALDSAISEVIDHYINARLDSEGVDAAPTVDNRNLVRRTTLDLAGRIPALHEVEAFTSDDPALRRAALVDRLLASPDFAFHQRNWLDNMLLAQLGKDNEWRAYLLEAVRQKKTWDVMFRDMMIGGEENADRKSPSLAFLRKRAKDVHTMTNDTSRLFFGVSINCAQCHDHPLVGDWQQDHYFGFQSFFARTYLTKNNTLAEKYSGEVKFTTVDGEEKLAKIMFLTGSAIEEPQSEKTDEQKKADDEEVRRQMKDDKAPPPRPPDFSPRTELVNIALRAGDNEFFARSIVNRVWARLMGRGLVHPLDQMHSENPASHPRLFEWLTRDLVVHNYDLKRLMRGIVLSDAYARSSRWHGDGEPPAPELFAVANARVLTPRQYSLSLLIGTSNPDDIAGKQQKWSEWAKHRESLENSSNGFADQLELPSEHFQVSVDEALLFSNSERVRNDYLSDSANRLVGRLKGIDDPREAVELAFRTALSRVPAADERPLFERYIAVRDDRRIDGIKQVVWALITSPEMRFNY